MKQLYKILFPPLLQKIDRYFLLNRPILWMLKLHYVCYYALIANSLIVFLVFLSPVKPYYLSTLLAPGFFILSIGELILFIYWWYKQSLYNIEKQYGNTLSSNIFVEIIGYSICILLIASGAIVFYVSTAVKIQLIIPRSQLIADVLMLDSIWEDRWINNYDSNNNYVSYLNSLKKYLNSNSFKQQTANINCDKNKKKDRSRESKAFAPPNTAEAQKPFIAILCRHNDLKTYLEESISTEDLKLFLYNTNGTNLYYQEKIFTRRLDESTKKYIKDNFRDLVESIRRGDITRIESKINEYIGGVNPQDKKSSKDIFYENIKTASTSSLSIYSIFYYRWALFELILLNYFILNLCLILVFFFKNTYLIDFIFALIYIFCTITVLWVTASLKPFPLNDDWNIIVFVLMPTIFISAQGLGTRNKKYSRFKTFNLVAFPFAAIVFSFIVVFIFGAKNSVINSFLAIKYFDFENRYFVSIIICLVYFPFLPYLKGELIRQLSLPKE